MGTAAAAYAHVLFTKPCFIVMEFVENLVAHTVGSGGTKLPLTRHLIEPCDLTGSSHPAAFAHFRIVAIDDISSGKAGAGSTPNGTGAAGNAAAVVFLPHRMRLKCFANFFVTEIRDSDLQFVFLYEGMDVIGLRHILKVGRQRFVGHLDQQTIGGELQCQSVLIGAVGTHGYTKAGIIAAVAVHDSKLHQIMKPVCSINRHNRRFRHRCVFESAER